MWWRALRSGVNKFNWEFAGGPSWDRVASTTRRIQYVWAGTLPHDSASLLRDFGRRKTGETPKSSLKLVGLQKRTSSSRTRNSAHGVGMEHGQDDRACLSTRHPYEIVFLLSRLAISGPIRVPSEDFKAQADRCKKIVRAMETATGCSTSHKPHR